MLGVALLPNGGDDGGVCEGDESVGVGVGVGLGEYARRGGFWLWSLGRRVDGRVTADGLR